MNRNDSLIEARIPLQSTTASGREPEADLSVDAFITTNNEPKSDVKFDFKPITRLFYKVSENPPWHLAVFFALQQALLFVAMNLSVTVLLSELVCARDDELLKTQIFSSTLMMSGLATFLVTSLGIRLPIYQGPSSAYLVPLLAMKDMEEWRCPTEHELEAMYANSTVNLTVSAGGKLLVPREYILPKLQSLQGSLMLAGCFHVLIATTGLVGFLLRFIGPITIVPAITLIGLSIYKVAVTFSETYWAVAFLTSGTGMIFAFYLGGRDTPIPAWNRNRGFHIKWYPLHQMFAILLSIIIGWGTSAVLTETGILSRDPNSKQFYARTDSRVHVISESPWFYFPYPGQFGPPSFNAGAFISFLMATIMSVLDSIGDYSACARMCFVPRPPVHAVNRGLAMEGLMSVLAGAIGCGHATTSYGSSIGTLGVTKVASRRVFQVLGVMFVVFSVISKGGAIFITIPYSVIGGNSITTFGLFVGIVLSNLQFVDLRSTRNLAIIGLALFIGLMVPSWVETKPEQLDTGNEEANRIIRMILSSTIFVGGFVACFLDNTVPGTIEERGLDWGQAYGDAKTDNDVNSDLFEEGVEIYEPLFIPKCIRKSRFARFISIIPDEYTKQEKKI